MRVIGCNLCRTRLLRSLSVDVSQGGFLYMSSIVSTLARPFYITDMGVPGPTG